MALKKSELYSSLWSSCDELRGGMDAMREGIDIATLADDGRIQRVVGFFGPLASR